MSHPPELDASAIDRAVRTHTARYCDAVARFDEARFAALWAEDADWVVPGVATTSGRARITRLFGKLRGGYDLVLQELLSGFVVPDDGGRGARARWQIRELQWRADAPPGCVMGIYSDRLVVVDGAWCFAERRFDVLYRGPVDLTAAPVSPLPELPEL